LNLADTDQSGLEKIAILLRMRTGHDFSLYKKAPFTAGSSGEWASTKWPKSRTMSVSCARTPGSGPALQGTAHRRYELFRDPALWESVENRVHPVTAGHFARKGGMLRAWTPGLLNG